MIACRLANRQRFALCRLVALIEGHCIQLANEAIDKIGRLIPGERSMMRLLKIYDKLTDKAQALDTPVQKHPQPMSIKLAALRRAKRNGLSVPSA
jgi:hypothetical protein